MLSHYRGNEEGDTAAHTATISRWSGIIGRDAEFDALYAAYQRLFDRVVTVPSTLAHWREGYLPLMGVRGTSPLASAQDERRVTGCGASARSWPKAGAGQRPLPGELFGASFDTD